MFDNSNPYNLRLEEIDGMTHYYVSFVDGQALPQEIEVSYSVYSEFCNFIKCERNLRRSDERHIEQFDLTDEMLNKRVMCPQKDIEEIVCDMQLAEVLSVSIEELPEVQRRRFILHYYDKLTYEQIAEIEECHRMSVCNSVQLAVEKIQKKLKKFLN